MILTILIILILILLIKISNNHDIIKQNSKDENNKANIKYAKKYYTKTKTSIILLIISTLSLIILLVCNYTDIDKYIIDYFSTQFYEEKTFNTNLYYIPIYIYIARCIIIQVNIGDYLYKYFKIEEPQLEENLLKSILYKKPQQEVKNENINNEQINIPKEKNDQP